MRIEKAFITGIHPISFRPGIYAEVISVRMITPNHDSDLRPCYEALYPDGVIDFIPISDMGSHYAISTFNDFNNIEVNNACTRTN